MHISWHDLFVLPERWMARYLRKRNWVVFYLEPKNRVCSARACWMDLYKYVEKGTK